MTHPEQQGLEPWVGYTSQSWSERYAELSRRYAAAQASAVTALQAVSRSAHAAGIAEGREQMREEAISLATKCEIQQDADHGAANTGGAAAVYHKLRSLPTVAGEP